MPPSGTPVSPPIVFYAHGSARGQLELFFEKGTRGIRLAAFLRQTEGDITPVVDPGSPRRLKREQLVYLPDEVLSALLPDHRLGRHVLYVTETLHNATARKGIPIPTVPRKARGRAAPARVDPEPGGRQVERV